MLPLFAGTFRFYPMKKTYPDDNLKSYSCRLLEFLPVLHSLTNRAHRTGFLAYVVLVIQELLQELID